MKQRREVRSIILRAGIFLLLGAIVNIAVAWGCAWPRELYAGDRMVWRNIEGSTWIVYKSDLLRMTKIMSVIPGGGNEESWGKEFQGDPATLLEHWSRICVPSLPPDHAPRDRLIGTNILSFHGASQMVVDYAYGWPCRSMWCGWGDPDVFVMTTPVTSAPSVVRGFVLDPFTSMGSVGRALPWGVLVPGFMINTLVYAVILGLLHATATAVRRWRRLKRGLCPACAYPVGISDLCTECGKHIPASLRGKAARPREGVERTS